MKRITQALLLCLCIVLFQGMVLAKDEVVLIYLNGSNTNDAKTKKWFYNGIQKFHSNLKKELEKDEFTQQILLEKGKYAIRQEPSYLYWGDKSQAEIEALQEDINFLEFDSPKTAQYVRRYIAFCLHDAIWVSKLPSMYPILSQLHEIVMKEHNDGNKTILLGYSAGTFITREYFLIKLPVIDLKNLSAIDIPDKQAEILQKTRLKPTCLDALFRTHLVTFDIIGGMVANPDLENFKKSIVSLDNYTDLYCAPKDSVAGIINYASPIALFFSDFNDPRYKVSELGALMYKYVVENGLFWLTVNYSDDPLGFPTTKNITVSQVEHKTGIDIEPEIGFFYDKSDLSSRRTFLMAHTSYWSTSKRYSKIVTKAFSEGYKYFHTTPNTKQENL